MAKFTISFSSGICKAIRARELDEAQLETAERSHHMQERANLLDEHLRVLGTTAYHNGVIIFCPNNQPKETA